MKATENGTGCPTVWILLICLLLILTVCFIFGNSFQHPESSMALSDGIVSRLIHWLDPEESWDRDTVSFAVRKAAHFTEFALYGVWLSCLYCVIQRRRQESLWKHLTAPLLVLLATATTDEFIQAFRERTSSAKDVVLDFAGGITGFFLMAFLLWLLQAGKRKHAL